MCTALYCGSSEIATSANGGVALAKVYKVLSEHSSIQNATTRSRALLSWRSEA